MGNIVKINNKQRRRIIFRLALMNQRKRANYLKKKRIFYQFGDNCRWAPYTIPSEPYMVSIGNHVRIAANVTFITHDIIDSLFLEDESVREMMKDKIKHLRFHIDTIEIGDYVMVGANSTILYGVKIGSHSIIAAGSVVTKDVPEGSIVGGNPATIIGNYYDLAKKRCEKRRPTSSDDLESIIQGFWKK